jgi:hypothetical protein
MTTRDAEKSFPWVIVELKRMPPTLCRASSWRSRVANRMGLGGSSTTHERGHELLCPSLQVGTATPNHLNLFNETFDGLQREHAILEGSLDEQNPACDAALFKVNIAGFVDNLLELLKADGLTQQGLKGHF